MSDSKKELIEEHKRLTHILKDGTLKERLEEYERQMKELKALLQGEEYKPEKLDKAITPDPNYKGDHQAMVDGKWHKVKNVGVDKDIKPISHIGENFYELEGHPEGVVHQNRLEDYWQPGLDKPKGLAKSNYGPKGAGLYDPTVNQKRKSNNVDSIEGIGQNKNVKEYTSSKQGTSKEWAATQAKKDLAANKLQPVKTEKDLSPEEREKKLAEFQAMYAKSEDTCKLPPVETFVEHQMKQPMFSSQLPAHLQRIAIMESSGGKNKKHAEVKAGVHKGTSSVSAFGLMPKYIKEVAEKFKPLKNSMLGRLIASSDVDQVNEIVSNNKHDNELANHIWNYNQSRLSRHNVDPSHLEALGVSAHRRGITGTLDTYKEGGINAIHQDPYVKKYHQIKYHQAALEKANAKLQLLRSALAKAVAEDIKNSEKPIQQVLSEIRTRQPTDEEIVRIMQSQIPTQEEILEAEAKASEERYRQACEDV